ncbi:MAG: hypothetical protein WKF96_19220 [Solirubrobacteraceae bacterium]
MANSPEARSPYALLDEVDRARDVLVLTYTASLEFFERFALSSARSLGALVTVVSDATMVRGDPVVVRRAGVQYRDARAVCPGATAFHPKLLVAVGDGQARVAIGSGNLTLAGWHANAETWTVLRADGGHGPDTLHEVAGFLRALASSDIAFSAQTPDALLRVANELYGLSADEPGPKLMHSLDAPIVDQLPAVHGPVDELVLYAPFHDGQLRGTRRLLDVLQPTALTVFVQPDTVVDGPALQMLVAERGGRLAWVDRRPPRGDGSRGRDERYWHGKLVQWRTAAGETWALTGSPNLSRPALLAAVGDGGNCELAVLSRIDHDMAPTAGDPPESGIAMLTGPSETRDGHRGPVLLAAMSIAGTVAVQLHRRLAESGTFERYDTAADRWTAAAPVNLGADRYDLDVSQAPVGQALRLRTNSGLLSNEIFVADPARLARRQVRAIGAVRSSPEDVALHGLGRQLLDDIDQLRAHLLAVGATVRGVGGGTGPAGESAGGPRDDDDTPARPASGQSLEDFLEACDPVLGRRMTEFALVLPALPGVGAALDDEVGTLDTDTDTETDSTETDEEPEGGRALTEQVRDLSRDEQRRYRGFVERLVKRSPGYGLVIRALAARTLLHSIAAQLWPEGEWPDLLADVLRSLALPGDEATEWERRAAGSVAAVGLALLRTHVPKMSQRDERQLRYAAATRALQGLLADRDPEQVALLTGELPGPLEGPAGADTVERVIEEALYPPRGIDRAVWLLAEEQDVEARPCGSATIVLVEPLGGLPEPQLVGALRLADETGPVFARALTKEDRPALAAWCAPWLAVEKGTKVGKSMTRVWKLGPGQTLHMFSGQATMPRADITVPAGGPRPAEVVELLALADEDAASAD